MPRDAQLLLNVLECSKHLFAYRLWQRDVSKRLSILLAFSQDVFQEVLEYSGFLFVRVVLVKKKPCISDNRISILGLRVGGPDNQIVGYLGRSECCLAGC